MTEFDIEKDTLDNLIIAPVVLAARMAAQVVPNPGLIVEVGAFQGELLEEFLTEFPAARGQWTDAGDSTLPVARRRLSRFTDRVDYVIGAPSRDVTDGSVPDGVDIMITSWVTAHRGRDRMTEFYRAAAARLAPGGCLVILDHARYADERWERRVRAVREQFQPRPAGPPPHTDEPVITLDEHVAGLTAAGFGSFALVWRSLDSVLFVAARAS